MMRLSLQVIFICLLLVYISILSVNSHRTFLVPCQSQIIPKPLNANNCKMDLSKNTTKQELKKLISDPNVKVILINLNVAKRAIGEVLNNDSKRLEQTDDNLRKNTTIGLEQPDTYIYNPLRWQIVRFDVGQNLLVLLLKFKLINLTTIHLGFREINVDIRSEPFGCESQLSGYDFVYRIREILLDYTPGPTSKGNEPVSVCSQVVSEKQGVAIFQTICYTYKKVQQLSCDFLKNTDGWEYLIIFRDVIAIVTLLFAPFLIPERFYSVTHRKYVFHLPQRLPVFLKITEKNGLDKSESHDYVCPALRYPDLKTSCKDIESEYHRNVTALHFDIDERKLLPRGYAAAEFSRLIYNKMFKCKYNSNQIQSCFSAQLFPFFCRRYKRYTWYHCCSWFMHLILILLIPLPWLLRLFIYYKYEEEDVKDRLEAAKSLHLRLPLRGSLLNCIPPIHWAFLLAYTLYFIDLLFFGVLYNREKAKLAENIKNALRDMKTHSKLENITFNAKCFLWPLETFGLLGLFIAPIFWVFIIITFLIFYCFYLIPMVHLILCLLRNIGIYCSPCILKRFSHTNIELLPFKERFSNFLTTLLFMLSLISASVIIGECVFYLVTAFFYGFIILILKANHALPYISLCFLVVFYFFETVSNVRSEYDNFQRKITDKLIQEIGDIDKAGSSLLPSDNVNTAHATKDSVVMFSERPGEGLICTCLSMLLFIDTQHRPHIPESFFYNMCCLPYAGCPGSLTISYLRALKKYLFILLFLSFVFIVVRTFFGLYNVSTTNQMLATLAGGFIPLFIQRLINLNVHVNEVDMETIAFKKHFTRAVQTHSEDLLVSGFEVEPQEEDMVDNSHTNSSTNSVKDKPLFMHIKFSCPINKNQETSV